MSFTPAQCRAARALIDWSQAQLASASRVATKTLADFEREARVPYARTLTDIQHVLERAGVQFIARNGEAEGVRMRKLRRFVETMARFSPKPSIPTIAFAYDRKHLPVAPFGGRWEEDMGFDEIEELRTSPSFSIVVEGARARGWASVEPITWTVPSGTSST
jgi:transcriptional regulator with XRE-family HTH domain